ncbi:hypothetical protein HMPREF9946_04822 [Acetobacteraceae bacterium AT-5844]|nr:hypothetical protein HMPREF9946_04822 [Acetobacteraceae bacterium AT-5844]
MAQPIFDEHAMIGLDGVGEESGEGEQADAPDCAILLLKHAGDGPPAGGQSVHLSLVPASRRGTRAAISR